jgi:hypothetical protein
MVGFPKDAVVGDFQSAVSLNLLGRLKIGPHMDRHLIDYVQAK